MNNMAISSDNQLYKEIRKCTICADFLPLGPNPVLSFSKQSKIAIIGQAPGLKVHNSGVPWSDASGIRLREWLGVSEEQFYDSNLFAIIPMGFCYPGRGKSGDLPPRPECATTWMDKVLSQISDLKLIILIGQYAQKHFLGVKRKETLTSTVKNWREYTPKFMVLPHPSPRNNIWLKKNSWFEAEELPKLKDLVQGFLL